ncbi:MAG: dTDP-glucose 4,6-dehydratase [Verrucomicrobia bacterium]|nr:dTDP-glucose 4,6-dehydratase [Verrucomicrobiota bacterium]
MQNVLVTGGAGFIGANFVRWLLRERPSVKIVTLDALTYAGRRENVPEHNRNIFVHGDIRDRALVEKLLREHAVDTLVHFAAESHVDRSILGPEAFVQTNIVGTFQLLEAARATGVKRFHHVSTDEVFGSLGPNDPAFTETTPYDPRSPYSASKAASDHLVRAYVHTFGLPATISNCTNNYGPFQFPEKLIPLMIANARAGKPLPVYGDGKQVRDWLYVEDHCEALVAVVEKGRVGETYNIGGGVQPTNLEVVQRLCAILDELEPERRHAELIKFVTDRPGHDRRYAMNIEKIERELGWRPRFGLEQGLRLTVRWYLDNAAWVKSIQETGDFQKWMNRNYEKRGEVKQ